MRTSITEPEQEVGGINRRLIAAAKEICTLFETVASRPNHEVIGAACEVLGRAANAHTVAVRSVVGTEARLVSGWSQSTILEAAPAAIYLREDIPFDEPVIATTLEEMPVALVDTSQLEKWTHDLPSRPRTLFCPIKSRDQTVGFTCMVGDDEADWSAEVVGLLALAAKMIGQFQVQLWSASEQAKRLSLAQFILEASHRLYELSPQRQLVASKHELTKLGQVLQAESISLWTIDHDLRSADRVHYWHSSGKEPLWDSPIHEKDTHMQVWSEYRTQRELRAPDNRTAFIVTSGLSGRRTKFCLAVIRPAEMPWTRWEKIEIERFADLLTVVAEKFAVEARLAATFTHAPCGITLRRSDGQLVDCNEAYLDFLGVASKEDLEDPALGDQQIARFPTSGLGVLAQPGDSLQDFETPYERADGSTVWGKVSVVAITSGDEELLLGHVEDVTAQREARQIINLRATTDALTGIANRHSITERLHTLLRHDAHRSQDTSAAGVVIIDLNGFKEINDRFGHSTGDEVLVHLAQRLQSLAGETGLAGRLGGDEFIVILPGPITKPDVLDAAEKVRDALEQPLKLVERTLEVTGSLGSAVAERLDSPGDLLARADTAMYNEKFASRVQRAALLTKDAHRHHFDSTPLLLERQPYEELGFDENDLKRALDDRKIVFWGQPILHVPTGTPLGVELLARWPQQDGRIIGPGRFVPMAERTGLTVELGRQALDMAARLLKRWSDHNDFKRLGVNVNISPLHLQHGLISDVQALLPQLDRRGQLGIELIESSLPGHDGTGLCELQILVDEGLRVIIDDFGVGHSSLSRLQQIPASNLKLDKSFIDEIANDQSRQGFLRAIVDLLNAANYPVTAEGVETEAQRDVVAAAGIVAMQGFLIAQPAPIDHTERVLRQLFATAQSARASMT